MRNRVKELYEVEPIPTPEWDRLGRKWFKVKCKLVHNDEEYIMTNIYTEEQLDRIMLTLDPLLKD